jgi:hypothetical protein
LVFFLQYPNFALITKLNLERSADGSSARSNSRASRPRSKAHFELRVV